MIDNLTATKNPDYKIFTEKNSTENNWTTICVWNAANKHFSGSLETCSTTLTRAFQMCKDSGRAQSPPTPTPPSPEHDYLPPRKGKDLREAASPSQL